MSRGVLLVGLSVVTLALTLASAQGKQTFTGTIADSVCGNAGHSTMRMGLTDAECSIACVSAHDADYGLYDGKTVYVLGPHQMLERFAGQKVKVTGTLDAKTKTIKVDSITAAR